MRSVYTAFEYQGRRYRAYCIYCDYYGFNNNSSWPRRLQDIYALCVLATTKDTTFWDPGPTITLDEMRWLFEFENWVLG